MHAGQGRPGSRFLFACVLFTFLAGGRSSGAWGQSLSSGQPISLKVRDHRCECILPTPRPDEKFLLVLGSLSMSSGPYRVTIQTEAIETKDELGTMNDESKQVDLQSLIIHHS